MTHGPSITVIDYGMGNLRSVVNALQAVGARAHIGSDSAALANADAIVLPGVGAFATGMEQLRRRGLTEALAQEVLVAKKPFLGICLGMQLLATTGTEHGVCDGLNFIPGKVVRIEPQADGPDLRIPHIGWNDVAIRSPGGLYAGLSSGENFYFVHSYVFVPDDPATVSASCDYGGEFAASLEVGNISAVQFHPEKSHRAGLTLLGNWSRGIRPC